ncbi:hypothetical protein PIB30_028652 [Stylosanthes scabra]|uniref:Uncharacterized protein n=1 Tax=Stylosanthes scabra TaxID=79078 RepID=A0ABU6QAQ9_9FABA|nr:hypothetical protein [Stylosanthes scabra]
MISSLFENEKVPAKAFSLNLAVFRKGLPRRIDSSRIVSASCSPRPVIFVGGLPGSNRRFDLFNLQGSSPSRACLVTSSSLLCTWRLGFQLVILLAVAAAYSRRVPPHRRLPILNGYILVTANGGINQQRVAAYVHQLESSKLKLTQLEQDLQMAHSQGNTSDMDNRIREQRVLHFLKSFVISFKLIIFVLWQC